MPAKHKHLSHGRLGLSVVYTAAVAAGSGTDTDLGPAAGFGSASHRIPGAADELCVLEFPAALQCKRLKKGL